MKKPCLFLYIFLMNIICLSYSYGEKIDEANDKINFCEKLNFPLKKFEQYGYESPKEYCYEWLSVEFEVQSLFLQTYDETLFKWKIFDGELEIDSVYKAPDVNQILKINQIDECYKFNPKIFSRSEIEKCFTNIKIAAASYTETINMYMFKWDTIYKEREKIKNEKIKACKALNYQFVGNYYECLSFLSKTHQDLATELININYVGRQPVKAGTHYCSNFDAVKLNNKMIIECFNLINQNIKISYENVATATRSVQASEFNWGAFAGLMFGLAAAYDGHNVQTSIINTYSNGNRWKCRAYNSFINCNLGNETTRCFKTSAANKWLACRNGMRASFTNGSVQINGRSVFMY